MRLLCDANIGSVIARALSVAGHDVDRAAGFGPRIPDADILAAAVRDDRILIPCDRDFGELVFFLGRVPPPSIIYIRYEPEDVHEIVPRLLSVLETDGLTDHMIVIDDRQVRRRPFNRTSVRDG